MARRPEGDSPVVKAIQGAERLASRRIESDRAGAQARLESARQELAGFEAEFNRVRDGYHEPPPAPHTRDVARRVDRQGAPLWALCDFQPAVQEADRAPIEAALEASGLLDAWITPDGQVLDPDDHDAVLGIGISPAVEDGHALDQVLAPSIDRHDPRALAVPEATVAAVLQRIAFGTNIGTIWVDREGRWQLGPLTGQWRKPAAQHIGYAAREAARRRSMDDLAAQIEAAKAVIGGIENELACTDAAELPAGARSRGCPERWRSPGRAGSNRLGPANRRTGAASADGGGGARLRSPECLEGRGARAG